MTQIHQQPMKPLQEPLVSLAVSSLSSTSTTQMSAVPSLHPTCKGAYKLKRPSYPLTIVCRTALDLECS